MYQLTLVKAKTEMQSAMPRIGRKHHQVCECQLCLFRRGLAVGDCVTICYGLQGVYCCLHQVLLQQRCTMRYQACVLTPMNDKLSPWQLQCEMRNSNDQPRLWAPERHKHRVHGHCASLLLTGALPAIQVSMVMSEDEDTSVHSRVSDSEGGFDYKLRALATPGVC